ncbi:MAG: PEP/pyruvate-binding domain-containing protein, partial [Anaerohalosphaeraceae bacterium]
QVLNLENAKIIFWKRHYIVENGWWKLFMEQKTSEGYFRAAAELKDKMLHGKFPEPIRRQFQEMMEYFGQSPIIVRSSSLLEDSFGNAFAGKYESIFLVNQGDPEERLARFEEAVRRIFASTMNENALTYRLQRGLAGHDEQMALLVQRVSGAYHRHYYFPAMAGVGVSYNTFVWNASLDPKAGMLRLVFGLGTRAVDRVEDDYPQTIALDDPLVRPYADRDGAGRFSQHKIDLLDVQENRLKAIDVQEILSEPLDLPLDLIVSPDEYLMRRLQETGRSDAKTYYLVTFRKLLAETAFPQLMHRLLKTLEAAYQYPVDIEFTVNFTQDGQLRINLVQCRPLQTKGIRADVRMPTTVPDEKILLRTEGFTMGPSVSLPIHRIIYVVPEPYLERPQNQKYEVARLIGRLNRMIEDREKTSVMLLGPGRWGTSTPSLGVPVRFAEISNVSVLAEIACEGSNLIPDLSFGTHFFQDLVESDIFYMAVFPARPEVLFRAEWFLNCPNALEEVLPDAADYSDTIRLICLDILGISLHLISDIISRRSILFLQ